MERLPQLMVITTFAVIKLTNNPPRSTIKPMPFLSRRKLGFTLIELLVTIAIIGILASLGTFAYTDSQKKGRDTKRKSDVEAIKRSLELMKQDSAGAYSYPTCITYGTPSAVSCYLDDPGSGSNANGPDMIPSSGTPYIKALPKDPKTSNYYAYFPTGPASPCTSGACTSFSIVACLENLKDPQRDSPNIAPCDGTTNWSYTIKP